MSLTYATRPASPSVDESDPRPERRAPRGERRHPRNERRRGAERRRVRPEDTAYAASRLALAAQYFDAIAAARTARPEGVAAQDVASADAVRPTVPEVVVMSFEAPEAEETHPRSFLQTPVPLPVVTMTIGAAFATAVLIGLGLGG